ncbi:flagellar associated protein [Haematococcus lacustris]
MTMKEDPTIKMLRSGFGKQVKSPNQSNPEYGFGTQHRDAYQKLYLSQEQTKAMQGNNSQGAVYKSYSAIGPQPESKYQSVPMPGFGTSTRTIKDKKNIPGPGSYAHEGAIGNMIESKRATSPRPMFGNATRDGQSKVWLDEELMKTYCGRETPAPNSYSLQGALGKQVDSKVPSQPGWRQSTDERFKQRHDGEKPGAGTYAVNAAALGKQTMSSKRTLPSPKIGTTERDAASKVFISKEHEKSQFGLTSPGPTTSNVINAFGSQVQSIKKTNPSWGFGSSKRWDGGPKDVPGPGTYYA